MTSPPFQFLAPFNKVLTSHLPAWFVAPGARLRWSRDLVIGGATNMPPSLPSNALVDLVLAEGNYLTKEMRFPKIANAKLEKAIALKVRQSLPSAADNVYWAYRKTSTGQDGTSVTIYIAKKAFVQATRTALENKNSQIRSVRARDTDGTQIELWTNATGTDLPIRFWTAASILALCLPVGAFVAMEQRAIWALDDALRTHLDRNARLTETLVEAKNASANREQVLASIDADVGVLKAERSRVQLLLDLTNTLSDDTWISQLSINGNEMRLAGFTQLSVAALIDGLRELDWISRADLNGPITFDTRQRSNRFELIVVLQPIAEG